jgi:hypothetical protein
MIDEHLSEQFLHSAICGMIDVVRINQGYELTLPQTYHTGHAAVVVVAETPDGYVIHDNSYAAMLASQFGHSIADSTRKFLVRAMRSYGCELEGLKVVRRCTNLSEVALASVLVGCASRLIADQILSADKVPIFDFRTQVITKVSEIVGIRRIRTNQEIHGHLGATYQVSAIVLDHKETKPVAFLEPVNGKEAVARKFKEFYDISRNAAYAGVERVAILNDEKAISGSDVLLMQEVSNPVRFADTAKRFAAWATIQ